MTVKSSICLGHMQRPGGIDPARFVHHDKTTVRSYGEFISALNAAYSHQQHSLIDIAPGVRIEKFPLITGRTNAKEIILSGDGDTVVTGDSSRIVGIYNSTRFGFANLNLDGREGQTRKGMVLGAAKEGADRHQGPASHIWLDHVSISGVGQQIFKMSDASHTVKLSTST